MPAVFSAQGYGHVSVGDATLLQYGHTHVEIPDGTWDGASYKVRVTGVYFFSIAFVKDAYNNGGTSDDVFIFLRINNKDIGKAWSGEGAGQRGTGAYSVAIKCKRGDVVQSWAGSDGGKKRHIVDYQFTGYLIGS